VFTTICAVLGLAGSPLAWLAVAGTAYCVTGCGGYAIVSAGRSMSSPLRALMVGVMVLAAVIGTWAAHDGIDRGSGNPAQVAEDGTTPLEAVKETVDALRTDVLVAVDVAAEVRRLQMESAAKASAEQRSGFRAEMKLKVGHSSESLVL